MTEPEADVEHQFSKESGMATSWLKQV